MFPERSEELFGGQSCLLTGDWGQLPPVMDLPLYTTVSRTELSDLPPIRPCCCFGSSDVTGWTGCRSRVLSKPASQVEECRADGGGLEISDDMNNR